MRPTTLRLDQIATSQGLISSAKAQRELNYRARPYSQAVAGAIA